MSSKRLRVPLGRDSSWRLKRKSHFGLFAVGLIVLSMLLYGMTFGLSKSSFKNPATYSVAYGSLNNFDCVNDTGVEAHGFEIELDDIRCTDISYTYDYNHYGVPTITEDLSDPLHPRVFVRYASAKNPNGSWAAYTAIPSGPINPTDGHQFTNPAINFGGEHFGVGYNANPSAVKYNWLIDDGSGNLIHGPPVNVATPTFTYYPPAAGAPANVVAAIVPPPPPAPPVMQFGEAFWVKSIKTTTHNANKVRLQDLVADDPGFPDPWANGEPDEVEVEWKLMQTRFGAPGGGVNGELQGAPEDLPDGDEIITRRYEFFKYTGPFDAESGEAMADQVGPDDLHGVGTVTYNSYFDPLTQEWVTVTVDLSTIEVVGEFFGAQMSGFDVAPALGLIDNIQNGELNIQFPDRRIVIGGVAAFQASITAGNLPPGMDLDQFTGILSGTPTQAGMFTFTVQASDLNGGLVSHEYVLTITSDVVVTTYNITTTASPVAGGTTTGAGTYDSGANVTVEAIPNPGYYFDNWSEGGVHFSFTPSYTFVINASRDLVANFVQDTVAPTTVASLSGPLGNNGWYIGAVEVTLSATDELSGVDATFYRVDGGDILVYTGPFAVGTAGSHTIEFWSRDNDQNIEAAQTVAIKVDETPTLVSVSAYPPMLTHVNGKMVAVRIFGTITDVSSGVDLGTGVYSTIDSYGLVQPTGTFTIAANGSFSFNILLEAKLNKKLNGARTYRVTLRVKDLAGNEGFKSVTVTVSTKRFGW